MHGIHRSLLEAQAAALGLPVQVVTLPAHPSMQVYEQVMDELYDGLQTEGFDTLVFGDIFLEDLKHYREHTLAKHHIKARFPLWHGNSTALVQAFIAAGFKAVVVAVNGSKLDASFCGRLIDQSFLNDLPAGVDPCGEKGEYHSFVYDGPVFSHPVTFDFGTQVTRYYPAPQQGNDCFTHASPATIPFHFIDLVNSYDSANSAADY